MNPAFLSSVYSCPAPPVSTHMPPGLPCPGCTQPRGRLLLETLSRSTAFEAPDGQRQAPVTTPAAALPPRLVRFFTQSVTLVRPPAEAHSTPGMCRAPALPQFPSRGCGTISGDRIQKLPLTRPDAGSRSGTVSDCADPQGLDAPFIVELFTARAFHATPRRCPPPTPDVAILGAPDAGWC